MEFEMILYWAAMFAFIIMGMKWFEKNDEDSKKPKFAKTAAKAEGRDKLLGSLRRYAATHNFTLLENVSLGEEQVDAVLVTHAGVVSVRCYGYNGQVFANPGDREWFWQAAGESERFTAPAERTAADTRALREKLFAAGMKKVKVESLAVFTSPGVSLAVPKSSYPLRSKELLNLLEQDRYMEDTGLDKEAVAAALKN